MNKTIYFIFILTVFLITIDESKYIFLIKWFYKKNWWLFFLAKAQIFDSDGNPILAFFKNNNKLQPTEADNKPTDCTTPTTTTISE